MIRLENCVLPSPEQMAFIIEGMRNPMNSWSKSDSETYAVVQMKNGETFEVNDFGLGMNDHQLMTKLTIAGTEHRKYMRMMQVGIRITAPLYWWKEFDTYKIGTVSNSCSTMHKIAEKEFIPDDFSREHLGIELMALLCGEILPTLNKYRKAYNEEVDQKIKKDYWWQIIQLLPSSYNQTRNVTLNYEVLANIYRQRKNHKLDEWHAICDWIEHLPYSELICQSTEEETIKVVGWRPIKEYDRNLYGRVLVKTVLNGKLSTEEMAELRKDGKWYGFGNRFINGKWYGFGNRLINGEVIEFFNVKQLNK